MNNNTIKTGELLSIIRSMSKNISIELFMEYKDSNGKIYGVSRDLTDVDFNIVYNKLMLISCLETQSD